VRDGLLQNTLSWHDAHGFIAAVLQLPRWRGARTFAAAVPRPLRASPLPVFEPTVAHGSSLQSTPTWREACGFVAAEVPHDQLGRSRRACAFAASAPRPPRALPSPVFGPADALDGLPQSTLSWRETSGSIVAVQHQLRRLRQARASVAAALRPMRALPLPVFEPVGALGSPLQSVPGLRNAYGLIADVLRFLRRCAAHALADGSPRPLRASPPPVFEPAVRHDGSPQGTPNWHDACGLVAAAMYFLRHCAARTFAAALPRPLHVSPSPLSELANTRGNSLRSMPRWREACGFVASALRLLSRCRARAFVSDAPRPLRALPLPVFEPADARDSLLQSTSDVRRTCGFIAAVQQQLHCWRRARAFAAAVPRPLRASPSLVFAPAVARHDTPQSTPSWRDACNFDAAALQHLNRIYAAQTPVPSVHLRCRYTSAAARIAVASLRAGRHVA
jgi:hypothetical protein